VSLALHLFQSDGWALAHNNFEIAHSAFYISSWNKGNNFAQDLLIDAQKLHDFCQVDIHH